MGNSNTFLLSQYFLILLYILILDPTVEALCPKQLLAFFTPTA
mgnify:CR=1 FL=1